MSDAVVLERLPLLNSGQNSRYTDLSRQRIYILPTRPGFIFAVMLITMLLGAINYNNSLSYVLTFLLASLYILGMLHTYRNLAGLVIRCMTPEPVFAGQPAKFPVMVDNRSGPARISIKLAHQSSQRLFKKTNHHDTAPNNISGGEIQRFWVSIPTSQRGLFPLNQIRITTRFPLGLFEAWSTVKSNAVCVVYPKPYGHMPMPLPVTASIQGDEGTKEGTNDFIGFRRYHPGDSIRNIAWKAQAREQQLLVKRFSGDGSHTLFFQWEDTASLTNPESRLSQLCQWILQAEQLGFSYGLQLPGKTYDPSGKETHKKQCLEQLARFGKD